MVSRLLPRCYAGARAALPRSTVDQVARWTGSWLSGPAAAGIGPVQDFRGQRLGLPPAGPGSIASFGRRLAAFAVDAVAANALVGLAYVTGFEPTAQGRGNLVFLVFLVEVLLLVALTGSSIGMRVLGLRVVRLAEQRGGHPRPVGHGPPGFGRALVRTLLLAVLVPALIWDADGRGLHDRAAGTAVLRD